MSLIEPGGYSSTTWPVERAGRSVAMTVYVALNARGSNDQRPTVLGGGRCEDITRTERRCFQRGCFLTYQNKICVSDVLSDTRGSFSRRVGLGNAGTQTLQQAPRRPCGFRRGESNISYVTMATHMQPDGGQAAFPTTHAVRFTAPRICNLPLCESPLPLPRHPFAHSPHPRRPRPQRSAPSRHRLANTICIECPSWILKS